jgi:putative glutathione S-transferase
MLVRGQWQDTWYDTAKTGGAFARPETQFRARVEARADAPFPAAAGRYHLYVSLACPWAHRTLVVRALKGLEAAISVTVVDPIMLEGGWRFSDAPGCAPDGLFGAQYLHEIYTRSTPDYSGRVTVPVLWDKVTNALVNNESSEILRMLDEAFDAFATRPLASLYPAALRPEIDALNARVYDTVNNGVYKAGFATTQAAYDAAVVPVFDTLAFLEEHLQGREWLVGGQLTEADIRLFTTLVRFDAVYHGHFKCNLRRIVDYPRLQAHTQRVFDLPGVADTVDFDHIQRHYYVSHKHMNPTQIVPRGPASLFGRERP